MTKMRVIVCVVFAVLLALFVSLAAQAETSGNATANVDKIVNIELKDTPVTQAIDKLFEGTGLKYQVEPGVSGKVRELTLKGVTFKQALDAFTEAARLTYTVESGVYVISPAVSEASTQTASVAASQQTAAVQPEVEQGAGPTGEQPKEPQTERPRKKKPAPREQQGAPLVVINQSTPPPAFYGPPAPPPYYFGYGGYPPYLQFGNVGIVGGYAPVVVAGGGPYMIQRGPIPPPPPGWVSADVDRFLRGQWAIQNRWMVIPPYPPY